MANKPLKSIKFPGLDDVFTLPEGQDGLTPTIGANGNWFLGDTDTGKPSRGAAGSTPVKGTDYFTAADKAELVSDVLAALPNANGVSF